MTSTMETVAGSVVSLWRYPVKSMMGEELNASAVTQRGLLGDRAYAFMDASDAPIYVINGLPNIAPGNIIHHPRHAIAVKKRCDSVGLECALMLQHTSSKFYVDMLDFFFPHLGVPKLPKSVDGTDEKAGNGK